MYLRHVPAGRLPWIVAYNIKTLLLGLKDKFSVSDFITNLPVGSVGRHFFLSFSVFSKVKLRSVNHIFFNGILKYFDISYKHLTVFEYQ